MYEELIAALNSADKRPCSDLECPGSGECPTVGCLFREAADAIEELSASVAGYEMTTDVEFVKEDGHERIRFVPKWIPVTERLPKYGDWVLGIGHKKGYHVCEYRGITHFPYSGDIPWFSAKGRSLNITHWMPIPTPPEEET